MLWYSTCSFLRRVPSFTAFTPVFLFLVLGFFNMICQSALRVGCVCVFSVHSQTSLMFQDLWSLLPRPLPPWAPGSGGDAGAPRCLAVPAGAVPSLPHGPCDFCFQAHCFLRPVPSGWIDWCVPQRRSARYSLLRGCHGRWLFPAACACVRVPHLSTYAAHLSGWNVKPANLAYSQPRVWWCWCLSCTRVTSSGVICLLAYSSWFLFIPGNFLFTAGHLLKARETDKEIFVLRSGYAFSVVLSL